MVDSQTGALRQVVGQQYIEGLPLEGRNAAALVYMAPGTVLGKGTDTATYATTSDTLAVSANGTMGNQVSYKLDGGSHPDNITNLNATFPNPDALSQFTVETNNFDARYGGAGGAVVNIVTKAGTNDYHFSVFEYLRKGVLNAQFAAAGCDQVQPGEQSALQRTGVERSGNVDLREDYDGGGSEDRAVIGEAEVPGRARRPLPDACTDCLT